MQAAYAKAEKGSFKLAKLCGPSKLVVTPDAGSKCAGGKTCAKEDYHKDKFIESADPWCCAQRSCLFI